MKKIEFKNLYSLHGNVYINTLKINNTQLIIFIHSNWVRLDVIVNDIKIFIENKNTI